MSGLKDLLFELLIKVTKQNEDRIKELVISGIKNIV